ncbi:hypothetical protein [Candidatus Uabimicrobium sp. HlEnr_7]|uniref:hypothetical protein n=1 Tax=Candidatus Uabimicrobium helgolandensis TaxID=3095367 RepID=UPI00355903A4
MKIFIAFIFSLSLSYANTVFVTPDGRSFFYEGTKINTVTLQEALDGKSMRIELLPGIYNVHCEIKRQGFPDKPLEIIGNKGVILDGQTQAGKTQKPAFHIEKKTWITISNIEFRDYWNTTILIKNSSYITVSNCKFTGARWPIFARGKKTHHLLVDSNSWTQDPSGDMWRKIPWAESHHGEYGFYNGALLGGKQILGSVVFRNNLVSYAYNAIRIVGNRKDHYQDNFNVEVYANKFEYIRDNPVEPEGSASNWWIHHNKFYNCYALLSFTEVAGENWFVFRNIGWWDEAPGDNGGHSRGKIYKFANTGPYPRGNFWAFHNSWYSRSPLTMGGTTRYFHHYNNAIFYTREVAMLETDADSKIQHEIFDPSYKLDYNISNLSYPEKILQQDYEQHSLVQDTKFVDAPNGNFCLQENSPAIDSGKVLQIQSWRSQFIGAAPDIGAFEKTAWLPGPPFRFMSGIYEERPRIVRLQQQKTLTIWFSVPMEEKQIEITIVSEGKSISQFAQIKGHTLTSKIPKSTKPYIIYLPKNLYGQNKRGLTLWSCQYNNILLKPH